MSKIIKFKLFWGTSITIALALVMYYGYGKPLSDIFIPYIVLLCVYFADVLLTGKDR